jgi:hypothetical protein
MSEQLTQDERRQLADWVMDTVMVEVHARDLLPLVLIAGDSQTHVILPCGPGADPADIARILREAAAALEAEASRLAQAKKKGG